MLFKILWDLHDGAVVLSVAKAAPSIPADMTEVHRLRPDKAALSTPEQGSGFRSPPNLSMAPPTVRSVVPSSLPRYWPALREEEEPAGGKGYRRDS